MTLREMLTAEKWDYVTIQQASPKSFKIETYRPYAQNLVDYIRRHAPQAEVVFHQTWAWREDHTRMGMDQKPRGFMYRELTKAYHTIAREVGIKRIIPVGDASNSLRSPLSGTSNGIRISTTKIPSTRNCPGRRTR